MIRFSARRTLHALHESRKPNDVSRMLQDGTQCVQGALQSSGKPERGIVDLAAPEFGVLHGGESHVASRVEPEAGVMEAVKSVQKATGPAKGKTTTSRQGRGYSSSRRMFLKALGFAGAGAALPLAGPGVARAGVMGSGEASAAAGPAEELVTVLDLSKCIGCGACVEACRESNGHKFPRAKKPFPAMYPPRVKAEDWSEKQQLDDRLTPYNWLFLQNVQVEHAGTVHDLYMPRRCLHCVNPPCANLCPWGAARKEDNGIVRIDDDLCLGGAKCRLACPWHIPQRQTGVGLYLRLLPSLAGNGVMYKCDRCYDKIAAGGQPACVEVCPQSVQTMGPRSEMVALARSLAEDMDGYLYGLEENGGTNTIYVSPVPFEKINAVLEKGPGKPHMGQVGDVMRPETALAKALVAAPVAGLVAGAMKIASTIRKERRIREHDND